MPRKGQRRYKGWLTEGFPGWLQERLDEREWPTLRQTTHLQSQWHRLLSELPEPLYSPSFLSHVKRKAPDVAAPFDQDVRSGLRLCDVLRMREDQGGGFAKLLLVACSGVQNLLFHLDFLVRIVPTEHEWANIGKRELLH